MRGDSDIDRLETAAQTWVGTPFCPRGAVKGAGVCCHGLVAEIYAEAGWLRGVVVPDGVAAHARANNTAPMLEWMRGAGAKWFAAADDAQPGDLLVIRFTHVPHHLAMVLRGRRAIHASSRGVVILHDFTRYSSRIAAIFRPREQSQQ